MSKYKAVGVDICLKEVQTFQDKRMTELTKGYFIVKISNYKCAKFEFLLSQF